MTGVRLEKEYKVGAPSSRKASNQPFMLLPKIFLLPHKFLVFLLQMKMKVLHDFLYRQRCLLAVVYGKLSEDLYSLK